MRSEALNLRIIGGHEEVAAAEIVGETAIAAVVTAWRSWNGQAGELPAIEAAMRSLRGSAARGEEPGAALVSAFAAAARALDPLPDDEDEPGAWLGCALVDRAGIHVAWIGGVTTFLHVDGILARQSRPESLFDRALADGIPREHLEASPFPLRSIIHGEVRATRRGVSTPQQERWPRPLRGRWSLLLAPHHLYRETPPRQPTPEEGGLRGLLLESVEQEDRIAALIEG